MGVTGARDATSDLAGPLVARTRAVTDLPIGVGLGVSNGDQAAEVAPLRRRGDRRLRVRPAAARRRHGPGGRARVAGRAHRATSPPGSGVRRVLVAALATAVVLRWPAAPAQAAGVQGPGRGRQRPRRRRPQRRRAAQAVRRPATSPSTTRPAGPTTCATEATKPVTLVFFGYTQLPGHLPGGDGQHRLGADPARPPPQRAPGAGWSSSPPTRPATTARKLRAYLDRFDPAFEGLTGDLSRGRPAGQGRSTSRSRRAQKLPSGGYEVAHGTQVVGRRCPDGTAPFVWTEGHRPRRRSPTTSPRSSTTRCPDCEPRSSSRAPARASGTSGRSRSAPTRCASSSASSSRSGSASGGGWPAAASAGRSATSRSGRCRSAWSAAGSTT